MKGGQDRGALEVSSRGSAAATAGLDLRRSEGWGELSPLGSARRAGGRRGAPPLHSVSRIHGRGDDVGEFRIGHRLVRGVVIDLLQYGADSVEFRSQVGVVGSLKGRGQILGFSVAVGVHSDARAPKNHSLAPKIFHQSIMVLEFDNNEPLGRDPGIHSSLKKSGAMKTLGAPLGAPDGRDELLELAEEKGLLVDVLVQLRQESNMSRGGGLRIDGTGDRLLGLRLGRSLSARCWSRESGSRWSRGGRGGRGSPALDSLSETGAHRELGSLGFGRLE
jgi:hypothetical protein